MRGMAADIRAISIHALREEGDQTDGRPMGNENNFYPRPPRGGRLTNIQQFNKFSTFLSTPSARRATANRWQTNGQRE